MKRTYQPKKRQRKKEHGFRKRMSTPSGRKILKKRRARGRKRLSAQDLNYFIMPKNEVLSGSRNFNKVYNKGKSVGDRYVVIFYMKNGLDHNRLAFLASKKVGNAVTRNRARRLMKESVRTMEKIEKQGYDIIFIARKTINGRKCEEVQKSIIKALKRNELK